MNAEADNDAITRSDHLGAGEYRCDTLVSKSVQLLPAASNWEFLYYDT